MSSEIIEITKVYARNVAKIESEWLESLAGHLVKKHYDQPEKYRAVIVNERVRLRNSFKKASTIFEDKSSRCTRDFYSRSFN